MTGRVAVIGLPYFASRAARELRRSGIDARYVPHPGRSPRAWAAMAASLARARAVYAMGSELSVNSPLDVLARLRRPILMHWVGSDVVYAVAAARRGRLSQRLVRHARHLADAPWLAAELATIGITARELPLPVPAAIGTVLPLPLEFRVLIYLPGEFQSDYRVDDTMEVVRSLPEVQFTLVGGHRPQPLPNLEVLGRVHDMPAVYARVAAYLRLTHHDGMSHSVVEALSFGRHVLWDHDLPGATTLVTTPPQAVDAITSLATRFRAGSLAPNEAGAAYVRERFDAARVVADVRAELESVLA